MASVVEFAPSGGRAARIDAARISRDIDRRGAVALLVEREIIPRLLEVRRPARELATPQFDDERPPAIGTSEVAAFARLSCEDEADPFFDHLDALLARGIAPETLFVELFAPAARILGSWWDDDERDFTEVAIGLWRLQEAVRVVGERVPPRCWPGPGARRALFAAVPGSLHGFGAMLVSETFARAGWETDLAIGEDTSALLSRVARGAFAIVGLSLSCDSQLTTLPSLIQSLRAVSRVPTLRIMLGGRIFVEEPGLAKQLGADGTAADPEAALRLADELVGQVAERRASHA